MWLVILLVLALFLFTLFWVVVPFVVQLIVTHSGINVVSLGLSSPTKNSVFLTSQMELVKPGVATMLSAEVKAFRMEMHLVPEEQVVPPDILPGSSSDDITRIGDFGMPPISLHGGKTKEIVAVEQRFLISSEDNMVSLGASLLREKQLQIRVLGHSKVHVPNILLGLFGSYSVTFDKTLTIPGLDNLKGVIELTKFELPGEVFDPDDKKKVIAVEAEARINNPTNYTLELGHVLKLDCQFQNASMSRVELIDFVLTPGITENVTVKGVFAPTDFEKAADFLSEFVGGGGGNDIAEQKVWLHAKGLDVWFNRIGGSSWTGGEHGGGDRAEDEEEPEHTFSANKDHNDDQNQIRIPWFSRLVQSMASETGLNKVDGREFIRGVNISEIGFDVPGGEDNLHAWGLLDIDFKIPFAKFNYSITSLGAELDISQNNYTSSTASMKETEVGYIPNYADHSGILRIKMPLSPVALTNASAFNDLLFDVYSKPLVHIDLGGKGVAVMSSVLNPRWHLHDIPISVKTTIQGWNQFRDAAITVSHIDILKSQTTATQVHVGAVLELENKTPLSANLGFLPAHLIADNRVSLGTVKAYNAKLQAWSTARVEATVIVDRNSNGTEWLSGFTSPNERVPEPAPGPAAPAGVVERGSLQIFLKRRGRPEPSALHQVQASRPTEHINMNSLGPPTSNVIMPVLERLLGDHLSNRTVAATACGAYEELWQNLTFLVPVSKRLKDIQVRIPGRRRNLLSWVQILLGPQVILLKLQAVMSLENTFSASLLVKTAYGVVYAGDNQDILFGSVNVTFAGDGWLVPAKSNATSEPVTGELLLQACVQRPLDCGKVVEQLFGNTLATLDVSMTALVEGKFKITVNATERNVPLSLHHKL
eukprot:g17028.t1